MLKYEALYIIDGIVEEGACKEIIDRFSAVVTANGGTVDGIDEWGKRRLAYPINYKTEGYYVLMKFTGEPALPEELYRNFRITDTILRSLITRIEE